MPTTRTSRAFTGLFLLLLLITPLAASAQFGSVVGVAGTADGAPEVLVLRPTGDRGQPVLAVYRHDGERWVRTASLQPAPPAAPSEGFSASLAVAGDLAVAGAGDADGAWAGTLYRRGTAGWTTDGRIPLSPEAPGAAEAPAAVSMSTLVGIMQPPTRVIAVADRGDLVAVWANRPAADRVRILRRVGTGWKLEADLEAPGPAAFGRQVVLVAEDDLLAVGAPGRGPSGAVLLYRRDQNGQWGLEEEIRSSLPLRSGFGSAVALDGRDLLVGAPSANAVLGFRHDTDGWTETDRLEGTGEIAAEGSAFGQALALHGNELWVGAPLAEEGKGVVTRYTRSSSGWERSEVLRPDAAGRTGFGASLAAADDVAVVGAPLAGGGVGAAAVYTRGSGGWSEAQWLTGAPALESITGEVRCAGGSAGPFECRSVDLLAFLSLESLGAGPGERVSDVWGWGDPETGREYALVGRTAGMAIVDITEPSAPEFVGLVPGNPSGARDIKTYGHHAFFTGDGAGDHGLVVFDLTRLRQPAPASGTFEPDARYTGIASAHNLIMDAESGIAIPVGANSGGRTCGGGFHMVDVTTPLKPSFLGCYTDDVGLIAPGRSHDGQCVVYRGPDRRFNGRRVCFASNETALRIIDITRPDSVREVAIASYPGVAYAHQGWLTEDHRYFFMNDELDELVGLTDRTRTLVWDVAELDDPILVAEHFGPTGATDHNLYIRGTRMYQANYQGGFRLVDISDPERPVDLGSFDTTPYEGDPPGFGSGAWTAYPFLPSGTVVVTSMYEGHFRLRPRPVLPELRHRGRDSFRPRCVPFLQPRLPGRPFRSCDP